MNGNLAQFGEDLRLHLFQLQASLNNINGLFTRGPITSETTFANRLGELRATMKECSERAAALRRTLENGLEQSAAIPSETVSRWIGRRQSAQLHARADVIEQLAAITMELAALSAIEAERITMTALLARQQAVSVQVQRGEQG
jgi:hypothetical protein